jgi:two-component system phosphate regulon response regulator OmpR
MTTPPKAPQDEAPHLLVVDDDRVIRSTLARFLIANGYRVTTAENAEAARAKMTGFAFDCHILDVMMPGENGLDLAKAIRAGETAAANDAPIIMLTARSETSDRIAGLERGVDDYIGKPFEPRELLLRIGALLRRAMSEPTPVIELVKFGDFRFHIDRMELRRGDDIIRLTDREKDMLKTLALRPGETIHRIDLCAPGSEINERTIDVQVNRLRQKIESDPANPIHLQTVRGIGYRLLAVP